MLGDKGEKGDKVVDGIHLPKLLCNLKCWNTANNECTLLMTSIHYRNAIPSVLGTLSLGIVSKYSYQIRTENSQNYTILIRYSISA